MLALSAFVLVICTVATAFQSDEYQVKFTTHTNESCEPYETPCALGCCPFPDATCCIDGFECCRSGQTCIPVIGICLGVVNSEENGLSLESSKSTPVRNLITRCPPGTTECAKDKCCNYPSATCCSDGRHCCPHGYRCDLPHRRCIASSFNDVIPMAFKTIYMPATEVVKKSPYKYCPESDKICPINRNCCITDNGQWDCCPSPNQNEYGLEN